MAVGRSKPRGFESFRSRTIVDVVLASFRIEVAGLRVERRAPAQIPGLEVRGLGSVPEIQAVETRAFKPALMSVGKVHREIDMSTQGLKTGVVEPSDRTYVAGYRPDR